MSKQTAIQLLKESIDHELKLGTKMVVNWDMYLAMEKEQTEENMAKAITFGWELSQYHRLNTEEKLLQMQKDFITSVIEGDAKWQAERMYSEEDIREAYFSAIKITGEGWNGEYAGGNSPNIEDKFSEEFKEWFEQFKKQEGEK